MHGERRGQSEPRFMIDDQKLVTPRIHLGLELPEIVGEVGASEEVPRRSVAERDRILARQPVTPEVAPEHAPIDPGIERTSDAELEACLGVPEQAHLVEAVCGEERGEAHADSLH